jgi:DNA-directed RNA polymerase specialized sigma24 family protein
MDDWQPVEQGTEEFVRELTNQQTAMLAYIRSLMPGNSSARNVLQVDTDELEEQHQALHRCLQKLRPKDRALLQCRYASEDSLRDYAVIVRKSEGPLKALLFNLRAVLRRCIEQKMKQTPAPIP